MAAFNWIVFDSICPKCLAATTLRSQCHVASSFDGQQGVRFCHRDYRLQETMLWWPPEHPRWKEWMEGGKRIDAAKQIVQECCYTECKKCGADLYAVVEFLELSPASIAEVGLEEDWPSDFEK